MARQSRTEDPLLTTATVCRELDRGTVTLWRWERDGILPPATIIAGRKHWRRSEIEAVKQGDGSARNVVAV